MHASRIIKGYASRWHVSAMGYGQMVGLASGIFNTVHVRKTPQMGRLRGFSEFLGWLLGISRHACRADKEHAAARQ
jgi:hypothetical protein